MLVYSSQLEMEDVIQRLRSLNNIKVAAETIRNSMLEENFNLEDKFCDAEELKHSWKAMRLPQTVCAFFYVLFNINQTKLMSILEYDKDVLDVNDIENEGAKDKEEDLVSELKKVTKIKSLYQMMFYSIHKGRKKTLA